jgi:hypothetical protein
VSREGEFYSLALQGRHLRHDLALRPHRIVPVTEMENRSRGKGPPASVADSDADADPNPSDPYVWDSWIRIH